MFNPLQTVSSEPLSKGLQGTGTGAFEFEHYRGGTPAVLVSVAPKGGENRPYYLSFFHSSNTPPDKPSTDGRIALTDVRKTYVV